MGEAAFKVAARVDGRLTSNTVDLRFTVDKDLLASTILCCDIRIVATRMEDVEAYTLQEIAHINDLARSKGAHENQLVKTRLMNLSKSQYMLMKLLGYSDHPASEGFTSAQQTSSKGAKIKAGHWKMRLALELGTIAHGMNYMSDSRSTIDRV